MIGQSRTRLLGVSVLVAMFVAGGLTGAVVQRTAQADSTRADSTKPSAPSTRGPNLSEMLKLTDAQKEKVCAIRMRNAEQMKPHDLAVQATWKEHETAIRAIIEATKADMDSVLTPDQRATMAQYRAERKKSFEDRMAKEKSAKPDSTREHRGRPSPFGVVCPGLEDSSRSGGTHGGPRGGMPWGGDSSRDRGKTSTPAPIAPPIKTEHQS